MSGAMSEDVARVFRAASKEPLVTLGDRAGEPILDRKRVEAVLPHRAPFLFVDQVDFLDRERGLIAARHALSSAQEVFSGHFPNRPIWPGVLQVEAIGQAGLIVCLAREGDAGNTVVRLTHIASARFVRPIVPGGDVEIVARVLDDGLFSAVVGQCMQDGAICSIAALKILVEGGIDR